MPSRTFTFEELTEYSWNDVARESHGKNRWSEVFSIVFEADGKYYAVDVEEGNTEYQDYYGRERFPEYAWNDGDTVTLDEVESYEDVVVVTKWRKVAE